MHVTATNRNTEAKVMVCNDFPHLFSFFFYLHSIADKGIVSLLAKEVKKQEMFQKHLCRLGAKFIFIFSIEAKPVQSK